jgi:hypothetical protein
MGFSLINHPFWGIPIYGNPHINLYTQGMTGMTMFGADFRDESSKSHILSILWAVLTSSGPGPTSTSAYSCGAAVVSLKLPSGYVKIALKMAIEIVYLPIEHGDFPSFFVCLPGWVCNLE